MPKGFDIAWSIGTSIADAVDANNLKDKNGNKIDVDNVPPISNEEYLKNLAITEAVNSGLMKAEPNVSVPQTISKEEDGVETSTVTVNITDSEGRVIIPKEYDATYSAALDTFKTKLEGSERKLSNAIDDVDEASEGAKKRFAEGNNVDAGGIVILKGR
mgnify:FL=1